MDLVTLGRTGITVNKNAIPFDTQKPTVTSGIRLGTPATTTRGMKEEQMTVIADCIADILEQGESAVEQVRAKALALTEAFPLYR